jgi:hypothetical protein
VAAGSALHHRRQRRVPLPRVPASRTVRDALRAIDALCVGRGVLTADLWVPLRGCLLLLLLLLLTTTTTTTSVASTSSSSSSFSSSLLKSFSTCSRLSCTAARHVLRESVLPVHHAGVDSEDDTDDDIEYDTNGLPRRHGRPSRPIAVDTPRRHHRVSDPLVSSVTTTWKCVCIASGWWWCCCWVHSFVGVCHATPTQLPVSELCAGICTLVGIVLRHQSRVPPLCFLVALLAPQCSRRYVAVSGAAQGQALGPYPPLSPSVPSASERYDSSVRAVAGADRGRAGAAGVPLSPMRRAAPTSRHGDKNPDDSDMHMLVSPCRHT